MMIFKYKKKFKFFYHEPSKLNNFFQENALEKEVSINNFCCSIIIFVKHNTIRNKKVYICFKQYFTKQRDSFFHLENNMFRYTLHFTWFIMLVIKHDKLKLFQSWHSVFSRHFLNSTRLFSRYFVISKQK